MGSNGRSGRGREEPHDPQSNRSHDPKTAGAPGEVQVPAHDPRHEGESVLIREQNPNMHISEIAAFLNVNPGRVSEALDEFNSQVSRAARRTADPV